MSIHYCEFVQTNPLEVHCPDCGRALSGTPERYAGRIPCPNKTEGPGTDLETIFKTWAKRLKQQFRPCPSCRRIKMVMDTEGKEWVIENIESLADGIKANSKAMGFNVPRPLIKRWLKKVSAN